MSRITNREEETRGEKAGRDAATQGQPGREATQSSDDVTPERRGRKTKQRKDEGAQVRSSPLKMRRADANARFRPRVQRATIERPSSVPRARPCSLGAESSQVSGRCVRSTGP